MIERTNFGKLKDVLDIPDLIDTQLDSFDIFLQKDIQPEKRKNQGLQEVFKEVFPIKSFDEQISISFKSYEVEMPKEDVIECIKKGRTYGIFLYVNFIVQEKDRKFEERVYFGEIPMMTKSGTFVINGAERVIISQLHRSPGICFEKTRHSSGKTLYSYRIIPDRGSWLEVQFDVNDLIYIYLDRRRRRRKFLITTFLKALGYESNEEIISSFYKIEKLKIAHLLSVKDLDNYYTVDESTNSAGDVIVHEYMPLSETDIKALQTAGISEIRGVHIADGANYLMLCLRRDPTKNHEDALKDVYRRMRPGDPPNIKNAKLLLERYFFDVRRYDLGEVGRYKMIQKLNLSMQNLAGRRVLEKEDLMEALKYLMNLRLTAGATDDIDHLGNRRVRTAGELIQNQCRLGLARTERLIKEKISLMGTDGSTLTPNKLINPKAFIGVIRDFFARSQLSQFMDQTNPLSELTNKRRLSALGPGGLNRERAGFEVRDVHSSHYGRVCPIETPEGPNIGLISSMSLYSRVNKYGFLETPYRKVKNEKVTNEIEYLTADQEEKFVIAQANAPIGPDGKFTNQMVMARNHGDSQECKAENVNYMDVSPKQLVSAAAGLVPFLEHDDANRALMGSNMQRQAVPLMITESPLIGTGLEKKVAEDSRAVMKSEVDGVVESVTGDAITIHIGKKEQVVYRLKKFVRSNAGTCINQRPIVKKGDKVKDGQTIADGPSTANGELALGKNVLVAFMPWSGYNFEDAIVLSERLVKEDVFTSIHVDEFEISARETKLGPEEVTRDIPNVSEEALRNLGTDGIVRLGAEVKAGDILVGKITPKSETELAPEERLLRAIFGEKASDVKDTSLIVSSGKGGIVMEVLIERSKSPNQQALSKSEIRRQIKQAKESYKIEHNELVQELTDSLAALLAGKKLPYPIYDTSSSKENLSLISANRKVNRSSALKLALKYDSYKIDPCPLKKEIDDIINPYVIKFAEIKRARDNAMQNLERGDGVDLGVIKGVKVYVASKRKVEVGDKMAGRHGNKGIVAKIVPIEDMPFMPDGTPVDIVLNPLGVPSRMNVGQVLETHLGWAAKILGIKIASPVFDGVSEKKIVELMGEANKEYSKKNHKEYDWGFRKNEKGAKSFDGKTELFDGKTGEKFAQRVLAGYIYMMKLDHLVSNKIHARAVGPYSLVTQQPLGGKAQHGGQRFGEMEVWALEAYGAAYTLQEMLTVKSDDVIGRARIYESIVKGSNDLEPHRPESFNVLLKELQSLGIDIRAVNRKFSE